MKLLAGSCSFSFTCFSLSFRFESWLRLSKPEQVWGSLLQTKQLLIKQAVLGVLFYAGASRSGVSGKSPAAVEASRAFFSSSYILTHKRICQCPLVRSRVEINLAFPTLLRISLICGIRKESNREVAFSFLKSMRQRRV